MKHRSKLLTISLGCFCAAAILSTFIFASCNSTSDVAMSPEEIESCPIYTQADMDKVLDELDDCVGALNTCGMKLYGCQTEDHTCPQCEPCKDPLSRKQCRTECRMEQYRCIYDCWMVDNGRDCQKRCKDRLKSCRKDCNYY